MQSDSALFRYYVKELPRVLHGPGALMSFVLACALHAVGHGLVALVGSALALSLTGATASSMPWVTRALGGANSAESQAFFAALLGFAVLLGKAGAGVYATYVQVRVAGEVGGALRLRLFDALL